MRGRVPAPWSVATTRRRCRGVPLVGGQALEHLRQGRIALPPHALGNLGVAVRRLLLHGRRDGEQLFERLDGTGGLLFSSDIDISMLRRNIGP